MYVVENMEWIVLLSMTSKKKGDKITRIKKGNVIVAKSNKSPLAPLYQGGELLYIIFLLNKGGGFDVVEDGGFVL